MSDYLVSEDFDYLHDAPADAPETETAEPTPVVIAWNASRDDGRSVDGVYDTGIVRFYVVHYPASPGDSDSFYVNVFDKRRPADTDGGVVKLLTEEKVIRYITFWRDTLAAMAPPF